MLRGISKSYRRGNSETRVLGGVDLDVPRGECLFLLGPSGSGKTTLMSIIGCVLTPDEGAIQILDQDPARLSPREVAHLRRDHIGFVFQRFHLIRGLTALENVCVPLTLAGWRSTAAEVRSMELLEQVGLQDKARVDPRRLSVGQCQRIAIARALAADPPLVLADEPTAALDADTGRAAIDLLRRLTVDRGKTAIIVTHDHRILPYADRVVRVERGELREDEPTTINPLPPVPRTNSNSMYRDPAAGYMAGSTQLAAANGSSDRPAVCVAGP
jgi:putative ABC transport system ATP-binding protein